MTAILMELVPSNWVASDRVAYIPELPCGRCCVVTLDGRRRCICGGGRFDFVGNLSGFLAAGVLAILLGMAAFRPARKRQVHEDSAD